MRRDPFVRGSRLSSALERVLRRVLRSQKLARHELKTEPVRNLRVSLRRCRSLAEGFSEMDHQPVWRDLRKACRKQQHGLAELRDAQVMAEWIRRLGLAQGEDGEVLTAALKRGERRGLRRACDSLESFSRKRWKHWLHSVPAYAGGLPVGESRLARIALERVTEVCALERRWRHSRSTVAWHGLRLAVKRFRYAVESFLPAQHAAWGRDLKRLQKRLGEVHDLDVLRAWILQLVRKESLPHPAQERWLNRIAGARIERTEQYARAVSLAARSLAGPPGGMHKPRKGAARQTYLWDRWRAELVVLGKVSPEDAAGPAK